MRLTLFSRERWCAAYAPRHAVRRASAFVRALCLALAGFAIATFSVTTARAVEGKLVGVVFDDSGSMKGRTNLPVFGIQLLAASLDPRDKLFGLTFRQFFERTRTRQVNPADAAQVGRLLTAFSLGSAQEQQRSIDTIKGWALNPEVETPFPAVMAMLAFIAQTATAEDDAHVFLITDGAFSGAVPAPGWVRSEVEQLKRTTKAKSLTLHIIAFADKGTREAIDKQGIFDVLSEVINGKVGDNVFFVDTFDNLRRRLVELVARISDTELDQGPAGSGPVSVSGDKVVVTAPFTVTRIKVVSTAADVGQIAEVVRSPSSGSAPRVLRAGMERPDEVSKAGQGADQQWQAQIWSLDPNPVLEANKPFEIAFNRPISPDTTVLLQTYIRVDWRLHEVGGGELVPDASGTYTLSDGRKYEVRAHVIDRNVGPNPAPLDKLPPSARFTLRRKDDASRPIEAPMIIDRQGNHASIGLQYDRERTDDVAVELSLPGLTTSRSRPLRINVVRANVDVKLVSRPEVSCPPCSPTLVEVKLAKAQGWTPAMAVKAQFAVSGSRTAGTVRFSLAEALPAGVRLRFATGGVVLQGSQRSADLPFTAGSDIDMVFEVNGAFLDKRPDGHVAGLAANTVAPMIGSASLAFKLVPKPEDVKLAFAGNTEGGTDADPLTVRPDGFNGRRGFFVRVERAMTEPASGDFSVQVGGVRMVILPQPQKNLLLFVPRHTAWCDCFVSSGQYDMRIDFRNAEGQAATLTGAMLVSPVTWLERLDLCKWVLIGAYLVVHFLLGLYRFLRTHRFPSGSRMLVYPDTKRVDADALRLSRHKLRPWLGPFLVPYREWHERRTIKGMDLEAAAGGAIIRGRSGGTYKGLRRGQEQKPLADYFTDGQTVSIDWPWSERVSEIGGDRTVYEIIQSKRDW